MPGLAPKPREQRRRYNQPARGEWVDLEPLAEPVIPPYEKGFSIPKRMWEAWRRDAVSGQWGEADLELATELATHWKEMTFADQDRRLAALGLSPKGKRDLRWRTPNEVKTLKRQANVRPLRVMTAP
jgi:hypothetical protein